MRRKIEFWYKRQPGKHVYDVDLDYLEEGSPDVFEQVFEFSYGGVNLQDAAVRLHHVIKLVEGTGELAVVCIQDHTRISLSPNEINALRESEERAREFFAPTIRERKTNANP